MRNTRLRRIIVAAAALLVCFVIGVGFSLLMGTPMRIAIPAGLMVSALVAYMVFAGPHRAHSR